MLIGKVSSRVLTFAVGFRPGFHIASCTAQRKGIAGTLQTLKNESPKREKSGEPAFPSVFPDEVLDFFHYEFVFPVSWEDLSRKFQWRSLSRELQGSPMLRIIGGRHDGNYTLLNEMWKLWNFFGGQKLEVCIINAPKCVRLLRNSNYFFRDVPERNNQKIIYCPTSKQIFLGTNRNIKKASHALLACHLLNDRLYLVCLEVGGNTEDGNWFSK